MRRATIVLLLLVTACSSGRTGPPRTAASPAGSLLTLAPDSATCAVLPADEVVRLVGAVGSPLVVENTNLGGQCAFSLVGSAYDQTVVVGYLHPEDGDFSGQQSILAEATATTVPGLDPTKTFLDAGELLYEMPGALAIAKCGLDDPAHAERAARLLVAVATRNAGK